MRRLLPLTLLLVALMAATARAQDNPFGPLPQAAQATPTPAPTTSSTADQSTVSRGLLLGIAGGVAVIFVGIGIFITRDARAHLTDDDRRALEGARSPADRKQAERAKARARAKGKAQRQARKSQRRR
jgi:hypothetical protein